MKKLSILLITFQLLSCGLSVPDIPLENINEHRKFINENKDDRESLEKAYFEVYEENSEALKSPYIYYYLTLIYEGYDPLIKLVDINPLESGLELFPNDPFLNNLKTNKIDIDVDANWNGLQSKMEGYETIVKNHPRFFLAHYNLFNNYKNYFNSFEPVEEDQKIIKEENNVKGLLSELRGYETADNNTSKYYNFNEIFSDKSTEEIISGYNNMLDEIKRADERHLDINEAYKIARKRAKIINQEVYDYFETTIDGMAMYLFFTYNRYPGESCVISFSSFSQEPVSADCGRITRKCREWNAIPGSPKVPCL